MCILEGIKNEKKNKLKENIIYLENISNNINNSINKLKIIIEKINNNKEELKLNIQKVFTQIRNIINEREDELLLEVNNKFNIIYFNEEIEKQSENLPKKIKKLLEKSKIINDEWNKNDKLKYLINICIDIEKKIKIINDIDKNIEKYNNINPNFNFYPLNNELNTFLNNIKTFGEIKINDMFIFKFKPGQNYELSENGLIATKKNGNNWNCTIIGDRPIPKNMKSIWKIKLNNFDNLSHNWNILVGIGPNNSQNESSFYKKCWTFVCDNSSLIEKGKQIIYNNHSGKLKKGDIVEIIFERRYGILSFSVNKIDYGIAFSEISKEEELYPIIIIYHQNDSVEII